MVHGQNEVILLITALDLLFLLQLAKCWTLKLFQKPVVCAYKRSQVWLKTSLNSGTKLIIVKALIKAPAQVWRWNVPKGCGEEVSRTLSGTRGWFLMGTRKHITLYGAFMVPVTLVTIMKIFKTVTKSMLPGKHQKVLRSGKRITWLELQAVTGSWN